MSKQETQLAIISQKKDLSTILETLDDGSAELINILQDKTKTYHKKLEYVKHELEESVRKITFNYIVPGFLEDTCYALKRAVDEVHGFTKMKGKKTPSDENPPEMIDVRFADGSRIKVPYGEIQLPQFGKGAHIKMVYDYSLNQLHIEGTCQKKYTVIMDAIMEETIEILNRDSIYREQAIKYNGGNTSPTFMDLSFVDNIPLFLTPQAKFATEPIEARIERTQSCIDKGIDLKFGVLLEGDYGTGKSLYAMKLAHKAINNGWTFIYSSKPENTIQVLKIANKFSSNGKGVVLFIEDIDKILNKRDSTTNEISLLMDGGETKNNNIISVFSTNHIERIDPTFLRGKRIGSIVTLTYLDAMTAEQMISNCLEEQLKGNCRKAAQKMEEYKIVPSFISEILDTVKAHAVLKSEKNQQIEEKDILNAIEQFKRQMDIAKVKTDGDPEEIVFVNLAKKLLTTQDSKEIEKYLPRINDWLEDNGY